jgi:hypothetical protein
MNANSAHSVERIGPLHSVYVGSGRSGALSEADKGEILVACAARFASFTCLEAQGYFRGLSEQTLVIQIASSSPNEVIHLAYDIALLHSQLGVGVASPDENGITVYQRVIPRRDLS